MLSELPKLYLARHGDTAWTDSHQHTGRTDLPLNERGEEHARQLGERLRGFSFVRVFTSPLQRASKTCALAGFPLTLPSPASDGGEGRVRGVVAEVDHDLIEWDYGRLEGTLTSDILKERPGWELYRDGCPDGESPQDVAARADRFIARVHGLTGDVLAFSSGHIIRMIAARWCGLAPAVGRVFFCRPASVGVLGFEHDRRDQPVIRLWNYVSEPRE
jgi:broad specificity phosphatase PhoE